MKINIKKLHPNAIIPQHQSPGAAGLDLHAVLPLDVERVTIHPGARYAVKTGLAMAIPEGYTGLIWPRSGLAKRNGADVLGGVIDSDYRGEVHVIIQNTDPVREIEIRSGDRIGQMIVQRHEVIEFNETDAIDQTERGEAGFGSTGVN